MTAVKLTLPDTRHLHPQHPADIVSDALAFIEANPEAWDALVGWAERDAARHGLVRIKRYIEELRMQPLAIDTDAPVKVRNAMSAPLGRILAAWPPELAPFIPLGRSKADGCVIPPKPSWTR